LLASAEKGDATRGVWGMRDPSAIEKYGQRGTTKVQEPTAKLVVIASAAITQSKTGR